MASSGQFFAKARTDERDWLTEADEPLAGLQLRSGGQIPGVVATPALLELVRKSRLYGLKLARAIQALDEDEIVTAWVEVEPASDGVGCRIGLANWQSAPASTNEGAEFSDHRATLDRHLSALSARLDPKQAIVSVVSQDTELAELAASMREGLGRPWTDFIGLDGSRHDQPMHWRLLDGASVTVNGSSRSWKAVLIPLGQPEPGSAGFELHIVSLNPHVKASPEPKPLQRTFSTAIGREIAPVLRQPISRIIANAETIRTQMAGPVAEEYSNYAADIASAGEHLLALIDDLADLEVVEAQQFDTAPDRIDLADVARRAAGILGVRASERGISIDAPKEGEAVPAVAEFRRVLQVLLNLLGNAIRYSPQGSQVWLRAERVGSRARITVADQGEGLSAEQQAKVFEKFERLGRKGDGGSGLGLYISRRLARAMKGDLTVESAPGKGARFTLDLPGDPGRSE